MPSYHIHLGDCRNVLPTLPEASVQTCITSPPYFGLRDYGVDGQIGLEQTPDEYVAKLVEVFREVRRVLRDDGTLWLNLGDSYFSTTKGTGGKNSSTLNAKRDENGTVIGKSIVTFDPIRISPGETGLKPKDLMGIPWRVAFALQQPYERVRIKDRIDRAWLAALIDGEGCITALECKSGHGSGNSY